MSYIDAIHSYIELNKDDPLKVCKFIESLPDYFQPVAFYIAERFLATKLTYMIYYPGYNRKNWLARKMFFKLEYHAFKTIPVIPPFLDEKDIQAIKFAEIMHSVIESKNPKHKIPFAADEKITVYRGTCHQELALNREIGPVALGTWWTTEKEKAKGYAEYAEAVKGGVIFRASIKGGDIILYDEGDEIHKNGDEIRIIPEDIPGFNPETV